MVIDDLKVTDGFSFPCCGELNLRCGLACSFSVDREVGRLAHFHTCDKDPLHEDEISSLCLLFFSFQSLRIKLTCLVESGTLCFHFIGIMGWINFYTKGADWNFLLIHYKIPLYISNCIMKKLILLTETHLISK